MRLIRPKLPLFVFEALGSATVRVGLWLELDFVVDVVELAGDHAGFLVEIDHANAPAVSVGSIRVFVDRVFACPSERSCRVLHLSDRLNPAGGRQLRVEIDFLEVELIAAPVAVGVGAGAADHIERLVGPSLPVLRNSDLGFPPVRRGLHPDRVALDYGICGGRLRS